MAEKTTFRDLVTDDPAPTVRCCANCTHGEIQMVTQIGRRAVMCFAVPPHPVVLPNGGTTFRRPVLELTDRGCDLLDLKVPAEAQNPVQDPQNDPNSGTLAGFSGDNRTD